MNKILIGAAAVAASVAVGVWYARHTQMQSAMAGDEPMHKHELVKATDAQGKVYYTCPMHPQVRQDEPGNCPICGMKLIKKEEGAKEAATAPTGERKPMYWYDPMKPEAHFDKPGKSPFMDMQLMPRYADSAGAENTVQVDSRSIQTLGIRTAKVEYGAFARGLDVVGAVEADERAMYAVESRATGWVEQLLVRAVGEPVRKGQQVAGVYSPDLYAAQEELILAAQSKDPALLNGSRQRLLLLGMPESQIETVVKSGQAQRRTLVVSPSAGVVTELNVREGQQVMPGTPLMRIADLSRVWITVEVPEAQGAWAVAGRAAEARLQGLPGKVFTGTVDYVYPRLDMQTRTVRARLIFNNPGLTLKPGMYAEVTLAGAKGKDVLMIPSEAVIRTGERTVVILAEGEGRFRPAMVKVGDDREGLTEVLGGLDEGETIVVSGQFLIDSEANIRGALARMAPAEETTTEKQP